MTIFITHAAADRPVAEALEKFLERRGLFVELEDGARGFRPIGAQDCLVALWSKDTAFSPQRLLLERRTLDAWADGKLALVKLDHSFAPVGLRDLKAIEASFEPQRDIAWAAIAKFAQEQAKGVPPAAPAPMTAPAPAPPAKRAQTQTRLEPPARRKAKTGAGLPVLSFFLLVGLIGGGFYLWREGRLRTTLPSIEFGGQTLGSLSALHLLAAVAGLLALVFLIGLVRFFTRKGPRAEAGAPADHEEAIAAPSGPPLFISYASADRIVVNRICDAIQRQGRAIWIDKVGLQGGDSWAGEIVRAIKAASSVAIMCSAKAFESDHVKRELYLADRYKKPLLPILLEPAAMPEDFEFFFAGVQWIDVHELKGPEREAAIARAVQNVP